MDTPECSGSLSNGAGYTASWQVIGDEITFTLSATATFGWIGIGFSFDELMVKPQDYKI